MTHKQLLEVDNATFWSTLENLKREKQEAQADGYQHRANMFQDAIEGITGASAVAEDYNAKIRYLLTSYKLWGPDGAFTFPDGETWYEEQELSSLD